MSIIAYVGLPGSGKSYDVVANQILPALRAGRTVSTNIPLDLVAIRGDIDTGEVIELELDRVIAQPETIDEFAPPGCVLVIDECWRLWPTGQKADKVPQPFKSLLAEHRHRVSQEGHSMQIVFVTQDLAQLAAFARQLVEQTFHHTKLSHVGRRDSYRIDIFHGAITGAVPPMQNRLRQQFGRYKPEVWKYYRSHTMSESAKGGADERPIDKRGNALAKPLAIAGMIVIFILGGWGATHVHALATGRASVASVASSEPRPVAESIPRAQSGFRLPGSSAKEAVPLRVSGWLADDSGTGFAVLEDDVRRIRVPMSSCRQTEFGGMRCRYEGKVVTEWGEQSGRAF